MKRVWELLNGVPRLFLINILKHTQNMKNSFLLSLAAIVINLSIALFASIFSTVEHLDGYQITILSLFTGMGLLEGILFIYIYNVNVKEQWRKMRDDRFYAGIGEMVDERIINDMSSYIKSYGIEQFNSDIYNSIYEKWNNVAFAYIHPSHAMKKTKDFHIIQKAFINAYV